MKELYSQYIKEVMAKCLICDNFIDNKDLSQVGDFDGFTICKNCENKIQWQEQGLYDSVIYINTDALLKVIARLQTKIDNLENKIKELEGANNE